MIVSGAEQSDSAIHTHVSILTYLYIILSVEIVIFGICFKMVGGRRKREEIWGYMYMYS